MNNNPLASRIRPNELSDVVGQRHLLEKGRPLYNMIENGNLPNLIFYGPSGVGKTTKKAERNKCIYSGYQGYSFTDRHLCGAKRNSALS